MNDIQKAIEYFYKQIEFGCTNDYYQRGILETAIEILEEKLNSGWISCDMDLPTVSDEDINRGVSRISVLAISKHRKDTMIRQFDIEDRKFYDGGYGVGVVDNSIVAWQMLPRKSEWRVKR